MIRDGSTDIESMLQLDCGRCLRLGHPAGCICGTLQMDENELFELKGGSSESWKSDFGGAGKSVFHGLEESVGLLLVE